MSYLFNVIALLIVLGAGQQAFAQTNTTHSAIIDNTIQQTSVISDEESAKQWNITAEEWQRYQHLMQGQLGIYSPGLDPLTALGIEAGTDAERRYYAELQVKAEARRVEKELAYQRAYDEAWQRLNPSLLPVLSLDNNVPTTPLSSPIENNRLAVFVSNDCIRCESVIKRLQSTHQSFDIYMLNTNQDDMVVRRWATKVGIEPSKVKNKTITLNHDSGRMTKLGLSGELPIVIKEVNGQWQRLE